MKILLWVCVLVSALSAVLAWKLLADDNAGSRGARARTSAPASVVPTPPTPSPLTKDSGVQNEATVQEQEHDEGPLWFRKRAETADYRVVSTTFEPKSVTARDSDGAHHRAYLNSTGHLLLRGPTGREIVLQRNRAVGLFAIAPGADGTLHLAWHETDSGWLRYERRKPDGKRLGKTKSLRSVPSVSALTIAEKSENVVIRYETRRGARRPTNVAR